MRLRVALLVLALPFMGVAGVGYALESSGNGTQALQVENNITNQQLGTISSTLNTSKQPLDISLTLAANCGAQGKFYSTTRNACCAIEDRTPACYDAPAAPVVTPGSQTLAANGTFTVPAYNTLTITLRGAGGGAGGYNSIGAGGAGGASSISALGLYAYAGSNGTNSYATVIDSWSGESGGGTTYAYTPGSPGASGGASGCDTNQTGGGGGGGGPVNFVAMGVANGGNGGSGGTCIKTYTSGAAGAPVLGTSLATTVGTGGAAGYWGGYYGSAGGNGSATFNWN